MSNLNNINQAWNQQDMQNATSIFLNPQENEVRSYVINRGSGDRMVYTIATDNIVAPIANPLQMHPRFQIGYDFIRNYNPEVARAIRETDEARRRREQRRITAQQIEEELSSIDTQSREISRQLPAPSPNLTDMYQRIIDSEQIAVPRYRVQEQQPKTTLKERIKRIFKRK